MNDIITGEVMVDSLDFLDPRKYRKCFTQDNEPVYVPIGESSGGQVPSVVSSATLKDPAKNRRTVAFITRRMMLLKYWEYACHKPIRL